MKHKDYLMISEFSKICEISRKTLIFYDNIGLFSPELIGENGYRYYSHEQIYIIFVINILKELGTPLNQIKKFMESRTPDSAIRLLKQQDETISSKIARLQGFQDMLNMKVQRLIQAKESDVSKIQLIWQKKQPLFISDPINKEKTNLSDSEWLQFSMKSKKHNVSIGYPEGFLVQNQNLMSSETDVVGHIICYVGESIYANSFMPQGNYLTAVGTGDFYDTKPIYHKMMKYISEHQLKVVGNAYEERLIDEIASKDLKNQVFQIKIQVQ